MAFNPTLAGYTLPPPSTPDGWSYDRVHRVARQELANGSFVLQQVGTPVTRLTFSLAWKRLSASDRTTIETAWDAIAASSATFVWPTGESNTVIVDPQSPTMRVRGYKLGATMFYDVSMTLVVALP